ncbi:MAG: GNAT family N-acetyltransferase [Kiloniellales bacterium]|nr:GNAT family N-acetyltransferase [Kiloniellales bacterium]
MIIRRYLPAPEDMAEELHLRLAEAGQALQDHEMPTFFLAALSDDEELLAGCKGEIAFKAAHVSELWVAHSHRGQGLGSRLLSQAETLAKDRGCNRIHLETRNPKARSLYEKLGFRIFGELPEYEGGNPLCFLEKPIA